MNRLDRNFFGGPLLELAESLLGRYLRQGDLLLRITEVEAYAGPEDSASHGRAGLTPRNRPMWGEPGHLYVYLCYGIHRMLNITAESSGTCAAILVRSVELVAGAAIARERRGRDLRERDLAGPGKVGQVLALEVGHSGLPLFGEQEIVLLEGRPAQEILRGPRVGIGFASEIDQRRPWRLADAGSSSISERRLFDR